MGESTYSLRTCAHYRNTVAPCRADLDPALVTDEDGRLPCQVIRGITGKIACAKLQLPPIPASDGPAGSMLHALAMLSSGHCPKCGHRVEGEMEFNGSILALPCRHVIRSGG